MSGNKEVVKATPQVMGASLFKAQTMDDAIKAAEILSSSSMVPEQYRGDSGKSNCVVAIDMANRMNASVMGVMQNMHVIKGKPSWSSAWIISSINTCGRYSRIKFEFTRPAKAETFTHIYWKDGQKKSLNIDLRNDSCIAFCTELETGEVLKSNKVDLRMAVLEGWWHKPGSKWPAMTDQMLTYRAAAFFSRVHCPDLLMGMQAAEEVEDSYDEDDENTVTVKSTESAISDDEAVDLMNQEAFEEETIDGSANPTDAG